MPVSHSHPGLQFVPLAGPVEGQAPLRLMLGRTCMLVSLARGPRGHKASSATPNISLPTPLAPGRRGLWLTPPLPNGAQRLYLQAAGSPACARAVLGLVTVPRETQNQATGTTGCEGWSHTEDVTPGPSEGDCRQADDREQQVGWSQTGMSGEAHPQVPRALWAPAGMPWAGGCSSPAPSSSRPSACGWRGAPLRHTRQTSTSLFRPGCRTVPRSPPASPGGG